MLSEPHNPRIAHAFFRAGLIEAWGRGIHQIRERCMKAGNPTPLWTREPGGVLRLRFPFSEAYLAADAAARGVPGDSQKATEGSAIAPKTARRRAGRSGVPPVGEDRIWWRIGRVGGVCRRDQAPGEGSAGMRGVRSAIQQRQGIRYRSRNARSNSLNATM